MRAIFFWLLASFTFPAYALPIVDIDTTMGTIRIELDQNKAPETTANFENYVKEGFYKGTIFHRVIKNFMIQGGGYTTNYESKPTHSPIASESQNGLKNLKGTIAMARTSDPHSATSQFFINTVDNPYLNAGGADSYGYTVFGKVISGMDVVMAISNLPTGAEGPFSQDVPKQQVMIKSITIEPDESTAPTSQN